MGAAHLVSGSRSTSSRTILILPFVLIVALASSAIGAVEPPETALSMGGGAPDGGTWTADCVDFDEDGFCDDVDCDDANGDVYPGAPEICDGVNNDCDDSAWPSLIHWYEKNVALTAEGAASVFAADVDGDSDVDILSASYIGDTIAWYENTLGDGPVWTEHVISTTADGAHSVFAVDLDGDSDVDVLSASVDDNTIAWYENTVGDGSVWTANEITTSADGAASVFAVDVDGDSDVDILSASFFDNTIAWHENTAGDGSAWTEHVISATAVGAVSVFAVDVDGDSDMDVLSASAGDNTIAWHENTAGDGSAWTEHEISTAATGTFSVFAADLDGDSDVDVLSASVDDNTIAWYENTSGDGSAWTERLISTVADGAQSVFAADVDDDNDVDVLSASNNNDTIAWYENRLGNGSAWTEHEISTEADFAYSIFAADVDGDGNMDVLSASYDDDTIAWYKSSSIEVDDDGDGLAECDGDCDDTNPDCNTGCTDADGDGWQACAECDDGDAASYPGAAELCDGNDNACAGSVPTYEQDLDGDGYVECVYWDDLQGDQPWILGGGDCAPSYAAVYPGAPEICDGLSNDCDHSSWPALVDWSQQEISATADGARSVFAVDVDGDSDVDVLSASSYDDTIAWYENTTGDGSAWTARVISTTADHAVSVFAEDVDGDADMDVLSASSDDNTIAWYENTAGDGSAWTERLISTTAYRAESVFAADVDGDSDVDVLSASGDDDTIAWYENTAGDGSAWTEHVISTSADWAQSVFAVDLDGDSDMDVVSASFNDNTIAWYENTAGNGLAWSAHDISNAASGALSVFAVDVDGDSDVDVMSASYYDDTIAWYENTAGDGSAWSEHEISTTTNDAQTVFAADVDGDGDVDVLSADNVFDTIAWHENTAGDGSAWTEHLLSATAVGADSIFAADVDGDSDVDVLSASLEGDAITWHENGSVEEDDDGDGLAECEGDCDDTFSSCTTDCTDADGDSWYSCAECDDGDAVSYPGAVELCDGNDNTCAGSVNADEQDGDGDDYVECTGWVDVQGDQPSILGGGDCDPADGSVHPGAAEVCDGVNNDCGHPSWPLLRDWGEQKITTTADGASSVYAVDVDGDSDVDLLSASADDHTIAWYENTSGDGTAWAEHLISTDLPAQSVVAADVDGDGDADVLSASVNDNTITWFENTAGDGSAWGEHVISTTLNYAYLVFAEDVDGDSDVDILSASYSDATVAWYENSAGDGSAWAEHVISTTDFGVSSVFAADVDGDGDVDALSASYEHDRVRWYENTAGDGSAWTPHVITTVAWGAQSIFAVDVDGDSDVDVLRASFDNDVIAWHENTSGDGSTWSVHPISSTADGAQSIFAVDVDGDGDMDALSASSGDDTIAWYENTSGDGSAWARRVLSAAADGASSVFAVDVDGDSDVDILSASRDDDTIAWYRHGSLEGDDDGDGLADCDGDCDDTSPSCTTDCTGDADGDGTKTCADCDDGDAASYPGANEYCDGNDNFCSGEVPADESDDDGDDYVECAAWNDVQGDQPSILGGGDCDDTSAAVYPAAPSVCDGLNNDCSDLRWPLLDYWVDTEIWTSTGSPSWPQSVAAADVDGDSDLDALSASFNDDTIAWYENRTGAGSAWTTHVISTGANGAVSVFAADVDGDNDTDVLSASYVDSTIAWYENTAGDGSAWIEHAIATPANNGAQSVFAVDVDDDGDVDVLSASSDDDRIAWYENTAGDGSAWSAHVISTAADVAVSVFAVDVDGDGDVDVLSASIGDDKIAWYENTAGDGSAWIEHVVSTSVNGASSVFAMDVDGDSDMDVLSTSFYDDTIFWHENTAGDGSAWTEQVISATADGAAEVFAVDVDGDGDVDVVSASGNDDTIAWYENMAGDGATWTQRPISTAANGAESVYAADMNGDGDVDVLSALSAGDTIAWYEHGHIEEDDDGDGLAECDGDCDDTSSSCTTDCTGDADGDGASTCADCDDGDPFSYPRAIERCDGNDNACIGWVSSDEVDGDGDAYVECVGWSDVQGDQLSILGSGDCDGANGSVYPAAPEVCDGWNNDCNDPVWPSLERWTEEVISATSVPESIVAANVDGDSDVDVLSVSYSNDTISWYENTAGDGSAWTPYSIATQVDGAVSVFAADMDGDSDVDVLSAAHYDDTISWYENTAGDGSAWTAHAISTAAIGAEFVFAADVDGDSDMDVLSAYGNMVSWYENTAGDGSAWTEHAVSTTAIGAESVFAIDLDGDSDVDVMSASVFDDKIAWYENTAGDGSTWTEHVISTTADGARSVFAADVDGDNDVDVLSASYGSDTIEWYENVAGDGSTWTEHRVAYLNNPQAVFAVDVDGDSDVDVLAVLSGAAAWYENTAGDGTVWTEYLIAAPGGIATSVSAADVNGDGEMNALTAFRLGNLSWHTRGSVEDQDEDGLLCLDDCDDSNPYCTTDCTDFDVDGYCVTSDCDDGSPTCTFDCTDADGDGLRACDGDCDDSNPGCTTDCTTDVDGDGAPACADCDDLDEESYPGATELCDGNDNDCVAGVPVDELDGDGDAYVECTGWDDTQGDQPSVLGGGDCDPTSAAIYPGAPAVCDGLNNDCNDPYWPSLYIGVEQVISANAVVASIGAANVDGDGDVDVLTASSWTDTIAWHENTAGDGSAWSERAISTTASGAESVVAADVDGDSDVDVLSVSFDDDTIAWYENTAGDGSAWSTHTISTAADGAESVFAADVDGDSDMDVLSASYNDNKIAWYENTSGDGSAWSAHTISTSATGAVAVFAVDVDGDSDVDVLSGSHDDDTISWYENTAGDGSAWTVRAITIAADATESIFAADVDGDSDVDVLSASSGDDTIAWYENTAGDGSAWTAHVISSSADGARSVFAVDMDDDSDVDVLSASFDDDKVAWYENTAADGSAWIVHEVSDAADGAQGVVAADLDGDGAMDPLATSQYGHVSWYAGVSDEDADEDGVLCADDCDDGNPNCTTDCTDVDSDGFCVTTDCDDIKPNCTTDCTDGDSDGFCVTTDCDDSSPACTTDCSDADADGLRICDGDCDDSNAQCTTDCTDVDSDGFCVTTDCDDIKPNCTTDCTDGDSDGYCVTTDCDDSSAGCAVDCTDADHDGFRVCDGDCDDGDAGAHPGNVEDCTDGSDNDCNGSSDTEDPACLGLTVTGLRFAGSGRSSLEWDAAAAVDGYALYRGTIPRRGFAGYDHLCEVAELAGTTAKDPDTPLRGESYYYLVTGQSIQTTPDPLFVSGSLGFASSGLPRPDSSTVNCGPRVHVDPDLAVGPHDGLSWATAYTGVSGALGHGQFRERDLEVWIRGSLSDNAVLHTANRSGARLLGGFSGTEAASWERLPETTPTTWAPQASSTDLPVLRLVDTSIVVDGLTLRDGSTGILGVPGGRLVALEDLRLEQFSGDAVDLSFAEAAGSRMEVRDSVIEVQGTGGLRAVSTAGELTGRIRGNRFQGTGDTALRLEASPGTGNASVAVDVVANTVSGVDSGIVLSARVDDLPYDALQASFLGSNLIYGTQGSPVVVEAIGDFATNEQAASVIAQPLVVGNTLSDGGAGGLRCVATRTDTTADPSVHAVRCEPEIWDNLITYNAGLGIEESADDPPTRLSADPLVVGNDLYANAALYLDEGTTYLTIEEVNALAGAYDNYSVDPAYEDRPSGDYHIREGTVVGIASSMRYLANSTDPGLGLLWVEESFDAATWTAGTYGVGYDTGPPPNATGLLSTVVPEGTLSVYTRLAFEVTDASAVTSLLFGVDYDDGCVAWLNGVEVFRSASMPGGALDWNTLSGEHESSNGSSPVYEQYDISLTGLPELEDGVNVLAIGIWNTDVGSDDLVLVPRLILDEEYPSIDAGHPEATRMFVEDIDGDARVRDGDLDGTARPDTGADER